MDFMNKTDIKNLKLNEWTIYDLRKYGQVLGVKKPTALRKPELIKQIELILKGEIKPYIMAGGRRRKSGGDSLLFENGLNVVVEKEVEKINIARNEIFELVEQMEKEVKQVIERYMSEIKSKI